MTQICITIAALALMIILSIRANRQYAHAPRLPMQWSLTGSVNWTLPRRYALAFMPILAGIILPLATMGTLTLTPRPGQEGLEIPVIALLSVGFIAIQTLHLRLIEKTLEANDRRSGPEA